MSNRPHIVRRERSIRSMWQLGVLMAVAWIYIVPASLSGIDYLDSAILTYGATAAMFAISLLIAYLIHRYNRRRAARRHEQLLQYAMAQGWPDPENGTTMLSFDFLNQLGSLRRVADLYNEKATTVIQHGEWAYGDVSLEVAGEDKYGRYKAGTIFYGALCWTLPRPLPNVFFDSKQSGGRQFRLTFTASQQCHLEGNFDDTFDTYAPDGYTIDMLSFITPDVMLALRAAGDYDIEFLGNRLLLYGPQFEPTVQVPDMVAKAEAIVKSLQSNLRAYRDERLPMDQGRVAVHQAGARLRFRAGWRPVWYGLAIVLLLFIVQYAVALI